ncbi:uncharacterized protein LOC119105890 [Pollicipes pollicipes]|uniref:uncharacterized protein LOC119105890 n=1 Tax=Pollicipes pollicipes TaxID=41117 RepID=UPI001885A08A|nr:uncharacterized protein LOC119105890 [Pollicipes pollicipes]
MKVLVVLSALAAIATAQYLPYANFGYAGYAGYPGYAGYAGAYGLNLRSYAAPIAYGSQYHAQDTFGGYHYGYADGLSNKVETRRADGTTAGSYNYVDAEGQVQTISYTAGANGFQVEGTNLPVAPVANLKAPVHTLVGPAPVQDTPEVQAARAEFTRLFAEAASRTRRSAPEPVSDTPEVTAEKARFRALFAEAAAAAEAGATPVASYLADTPEVAAEKARFEAAFKTAEARAALPLTYAARPLAYNGLPYAGLPYAGLPYAAPFAGFNRFFY